MLRNKLGKQIRVKNPHNRIDFIYEIEKWIDARYTKQAPSQFKLSCGEPVEVLKKDAIFKDVNGCIWTAV